MQRRRVLLAAAVAGIAGAWWLSGVQDDRAADRHSAHQRTSVTRGAARSTGDTSTARLHGQVVDAEGAPVEHATVHVGPSHEAVTNREGRFELSGLAPGPANLVAHSTDAAAGPIPVRLGAQGFIRVRLHRAVTIEIQVVSAADGRSIAAPRGTLYLAAHDDGAPTPIVGTSPSAGIVRFSAAPLGAFRVEVEADGFAPTARHVSWNDHNGDDWRVTIALERGVAIRGQVVDEAGTPLADAQVTPQPVAQANRHGGGAHVADPDRAASATDGAGRFTCVVPIGERFVLIGRYSGFAPEMSEPLVADQPRDVTLTLRPGTSVAGTVVDADGEPIAGAIVRAPGGPSAVSDGDGRFVLAGFAPTTRASVLVASTDTSSSAPTRVELPSEDVEIVLDRDAKLTGSVERADGGPVPDAIVTVHGASVEREARADQAGRFELRGLAPGTYVAIARSPESDPDRIGQPVMGTASVSPGDEPVKLTVPAPAALVGRVLVGGRPATDLQISIPSFSAAQAVDTSDGRFVLGPLNAIGGRFSVVVAARGGVPREIAVEIAPGQTTDAGVIELAMGRVLRGRVERISGGPAADAVVVIRGHEVAATTVRSDELGRFATVVPHGPVAIQAVMRGVGSSAPLAIEAEQSSLDVVLRLPVTARVAVEVNAAEDALIVRLARVGPEDGGIKYWILGRVGATRTFTGEVAVGTYQLWAESNPAFTPPANAVTVRVEEGAMNHFVLGTYP